MLWRLNVQMNCKSSIFIFSSTKQIKEKKKLLETTAYNELEWKKNGEEWRRMRRRKSTPEHRRIWNHWGSWRRWRSRRDRFRVRQRTDQSRRFLGYVAGTLESPPPPFFKFSCNGVRRPLSYSLFCLLSLYSIPSLPQSMAYGGLLSLLRCCFLLCCEFVIGQSWMGRAS